jgi:DNA modification methylase
MESAAVWVSIDELRPWDKNPRKNEKAIPKVVESIKRFGFAAPIIARLDGEIIAGHTRYQAAKQLGLDRVPVRYMDLDPADARLLALTDNKLNEISEWEETLLADILKDIDLKDASLAGFGSDELKSLLSEMDDPVAFLAEHDDVPEVLENPITKLGDLWLMGRHRLLCGSCTNQTDQDRLIDGGKVRTVITSPPYFNQRDYAHWERYDDYLSDMVRVVDRLDEPVLICWNVGDSVPEHLDIPADTSVAFSRAGFKYVDKIVWRKPRAVFDCPRNGHISKQRYYPAFAWEPILIFRKGAHPKFDFDDISFWNDNVTNVWDIETVSSNAKEHPAAFPVELPSRLIRAYSQLGDIIYDPFGGSGSTLIACEKYGRLGFLMELDPRYCDVIVRRWEQFTGMKAKRSNGENE